MFKKFELKWGIIVWVCLGFVYRIIEECWESFLMMIRGVEGLGCVQMG
jgi:hypothetical protein